MTNRYYSLIDLEKIETKEGHMFPIYKDWEYKDNKFKPEMVYVTTIKPTMSKDIIYHKKRISFLTCIQGKLTIELMCNDTIEKIILNDENKNSNSKIIMINPNVPFKLSNEGTSLAIIVNCPTYAWRPNSDEMIKFDNWKEYKKWKG
jgi:hypothetical protein